MSVQCFLLVPSMGEEEKVTLCPPPKLSLICLASCLGRRYWDILEAQSNRDPTYWKKKWWFFIFLYVLKAAIVAKLAVIFLISYSSLNVFPRSYTETSKLFLRVFQSSGVTELSHICQSLLSVKVIV